MQAYRWTDSHSEGKRYIPKLFTAQKIKYIATVILMYFMLDTSYGPRK